MGIYFIMKNNLKRNICHKVRFLVGFLLPIIICVTAGLFSGTVNPKVRVGILINEEEKANKATLWEQILLNEVFEFETARKESIHTDLIMGKYRFILDGRDAGCMENLKIITYAKEEEKKSFRNSIFSSNSIEVQIPEPITKTESTMAFFMTLFMVMATINAAALIKDKQNGLYSRFLMTPQKKSNYFWGNYGYNFLLTLLQLSIAAGGMFLLQKNIDISVMEVMILVLFITLTSTVFAGLLALVCTSDVQANICAGSIAAIVMLIGGTFVSVKSMPQVLQYASMASPVRWVIELTKFLE